ncbi:pyrG [Acrasis kona]|uniref:PyrG n=1 Tax=Acrasis kona TaxID=1008807 RepID=A0AAW2ZDK0_9EUKA
MSTLTLRSSPHQGPVAPTPFKPSLLPITRQTASNNNDILVPKPVKPTLEFASPVKAAPQQFIGQDLPRPISRSTSFENTVNYFKPSTPVRSLSRDSFHQCSDDDSSCSSPERLAGIEIQNILVQRTLLESSSGFQAATKSPLPSTKTNLLTPNNAVKRLNFFEEAEVESMSRFVTSPAHAPTMHKFEDETTDDSEVYDSDSEDEYSHDDYSRQGNFRTFDMYGSDDEQEDYYSSQCGSFDAYTAFRSMTPPARAENPLCYDDRFQHFCSTPVPDRKRMEIGVELGLFNFSPIPSKH